MDDRHRHRLVVMAMVLMVVLSTSKARLICEQRFRSTIAIEPCLQVDINNCMEISQRGRPGHSCIVDVLDGRHCWEFFNCVVVITTTATTAATTTTTTHTTSTTTDSPTTTNAPTTHDNIIDGIVGGIVGVLVLGGLGVVFAVWWWRLSRLWWGGYHRFRGNPPLDNIALLLRNQGPQDEEDPEVDDQPGEVCI